MGKIVLLALAAGVAGFLFLSHKRAEAAERKLAVIASEIAGRPVRVDCQGAVGAALDVSPHAGTVDFDADWKPADVTNLKRSVCRKLNGFPGEHQRPAFACFERGDRCPASVIASAWAVQTLAHEGWHLRGEVDEARTQCFGLQTTAWVAGELGAPPERAHAIASYLYVHLYPRMPDAYRSSECRDGGELDLRRTSAVWP